MRLLWLGGGAALLIVIIGMPGIITCRRDRAHAVELAQYETTKARWHALISLEPCLRETSQAIENLTGPDAATPDLPRPDRAAHQVQLRRLADDGCVWKLTTLEWIPGLAPGNAALVRWKLAESGLARHGLTLPERAWTRISSADYAPRLAEYAVATEASWREVLPLARAELRSMQQAYEQAEGRTASWWRIELGFAWNDLVNAGRRGQSPDQIKRLASTLASMIADAPLEVRRDLRSVSESVSQILGGSTTGARELTDHVLWHATRDDGMGPIPKPPAVPEGCGGGDGL